MLDPMARPRRKPDVNPFEVIGQIRLTDTLPVHSSKRLAAIITAPPSDYEIIFAQGFEIAHLRGEVDRLTREQS